MKTSFCSRAYVTVRILFKLWGDESTLVLAFSVSANGFCTSLLWYSNYLLLVNRWSWPEMRSVSLLPSHFLVLSISVSFQTHLEGGTQPVAEHALKPLCNAETPRGIVRWKDKRFTWWLFCFGVTWLPSPLLRNTIQNWEQVSWITALLPWSGSLYRALVRARGRTELWRALVGLCFFSTLFF